MSVIVSNYLILFHYPLNYAKTEEFDQDCVVSEGCLGLSHPVWELLVGLGYPSSRLQLLNF